jgi:hypothetical protein
MRLDKEDFSAEPPRCRQILFLLTVSLELLQLCGQLFRKVCADARSANNSIDVLAHQRRLLRHGNLLSYELNGSLAGSEWVYFFTAPRGQQDLVTVASWQRGAAVMSSQDTSEDAVRQLREWINGFRTTQLLAVAARLQLADLLQDGPRSSAELAAATGANADALVRLLRTLASLGVFAEPAPDQFALTPLAALLQRDHPQSLWAVSRMAGEEQYRAWGGLYDSVMTGAPAFPQIYGMRRFEYLAQHPDAEAIFSQGMSEKVRLSATAFATAYPFPAGGAVVDVGGGHGVLLSAALRAHPSVRGVLFDQPQVVAGAAATLEAAGVAERCALVGGDFFVAVPSDGAVYVLCEVIHDWDDVHALQILRRCAEAMAPDAKIVLVEKVITSGAAALSAHLLDLHMLVMHGGRERTIEEFARLFAAAGLRLTRTMPLGSDERIVEGERAPAE